MADGVRDFSTLEAVHPSYQPVQNSKPQLIDDGKQTIVEDPGKYTVPYGDAPEATFNEQFPTKSGPTEPALNEKQQKGWMRRNWLLLGGVVLLIVILAVVLGVVLGSKKSKHSTPTSTPSPPSTVSNDTIRYQRDIAAISFALNGVNNTRVYFQDDTGGLVQSGNSESTAGWSSPSSLGFTGRNGTSLAAAVSRPGSPFEISVFYTDSNYRVCDIIYEPSTGNWTSGTISSMNYITHPNSSLTALYYQCAYCSNTTILAYQDINGFIQAANQTSSGWQSTQVNSNPQDFIEGTGLAFQPHYLTGQADQVNLYHQMSSLNISLTVYTPTDSSKSADYFWNSDVQIYDIGQPATPLAAASAYTNGSSGYENWIELLQVSNQGIEVNTWSGNWIKVNNHPSLMANSTVDVKTYGAIAVTAIGKAFAVVSTAGNDSIQSWQLGDDIVDWAAAGPVDTGNAWR